MKAAQEVLIFSFLNFFTFFPNVVFERKKNPSPTVIQNQMQTTEKKNP